MIENDDPITHQEGFALVVRHVNERGAKTAMKVDHLVAQTGPQRQVETREWLVEEDDAGLARQGPADRHPLPLSSGKGAGTTHQDMVEPEHARHRIDPRPRLVARDSAHLEPECQVVEYR